MENPCLPDLKKTESVSRPLKEGLSVGATFPREQDLHPLGNGGMAI